jgi:5-methylcytosine-specific restriction endonuclease McrA
MDRQTRQAVIQRASNRCEYCMQPQGPTPYITFHVEHVFAQQHVLDDSLDNLALACPDCNFHKGPNLTTIDPVSRKIMNLFHPRLDHWPNHFFFEGAILRHSTEIGRATIWLLQLNKESRLELRRLLMDSGEM